MKETTEPSPDFLNRLKFRRQFLLGPIAYIPNAYWDRVELKNSLILSIHKDLSHFSVEHDDKKLTLIGTAIDCTDPKKLPPEITASLIKPDSDIYSIIEASGPIAGRWVIIFQDGEDTYIFTDLCGQRKVYYTSSNTDSWVASQPNLINKVHPLEPVDIKEIHSFRRTEKFIERGSRWYGNKTELKNCYHIVPNHFLDLKSDRLIRFFPSSDKPIFTSQNTERIAEEAAEYLKNILNGINNQFTPRMPLTSGFDTRLLLAASVDFADKVSFYVDRRGILKSHHNDIYVPRNLSKKLNLNLNIVDGKKPIPDWFTTIVKENIYGARHIKTKYFLRIAYEKLIEGDTDHLLINGNIIEIVRVMEKMNKYDELIREDGTTSNAHSLMKYTGYKSEFLENELRQWESTIDTSPIDEAKLIDMFYWEQEMGNWMALNTAEVEIATDVISPFNCRLLIETCLKAPREKRMAPDYPFFKLIMQQLWPDVLSEPINPGAKGFGLIKEKLRENLPDKMVSTLLKIIR